MTIILLTSGAVLLLTCAAFLAYEFLTFRQTTVRELSTLGKIIAANSTAALAFQNQDDARELLAALKSRAARRGRRALRQRGPAVFAVSRQACPPMPFLPRRQRMAIVSSTHTWRVLSRSSRATTGVWARSTSNRTLGAMYERLRLYGAIARLSDHGSFSWSLTCCPECSNDRSREPILALAETAKAVSDRRDYSVRATKLGTGRIGPAHRCLQPDAHAHPRAKRGVEGRRGTRASGLEFGAQRRGRDRCGGQDHRLECPGRDMFGWTRREALGRSWLKPSSHARYREAYRRGVARFLDDRRRSGPELGSSR